MDNGRQIMRDRLSRERKEALEKELKKDKKYVVYVNIKFEAIFSHFEEIEGEHYAVFIDTGVTDHGKVPTRKVKVNRITSTGLIKT